MANGIIRLDEGWRLDEGHHLDQPPNVPAPVTPPRKRRRSNIKSNTITIMPDYIPTKRELRRAWLQNISAKAAAQVVAGGGTAAVATNLTTAADAIIAAYDETDSAKTTYEGKKAMEQNTEDTQIAIIRSILTSLKVLPNWKSSGADAELQSSASGSEMDPGTYKPVISVEMKGGLITLSSKRRAWMRWRFTAVCVARWAGRSSAWTPPRRTLMAGRWRRRAWRRSASTWRAA
jgi:hypothetical protein